MGDDSFTFLPFLFSFLLFLVGWVMPYFISGPSITCLKGPPSIVFLYLFTLPKERLYFVQVNKDLGLCFLTEGSLK